MKSDEDYFSRNMTYFNVFLRILRLGENTRILPYFITGLNVRNNYVLQFVETMLVGLYGRFWTISISASDRPYNPTNA